MKWPRHAEAVSRRAALWAGAACLVLWTLDALVNHYRPAWLARLEPFEEPLGAPRFLAPLASLPLLFLARRLKPREVGFTLGSPKATFFWCFAPLLLGLVAFLAVAAILAILFHFTGWRLPGGWLSTTAVHSLAQWRWRNEWAWQLWRWCGQAPLLEEPVYRALPYAALLPFVGKRGAILGVAVVWTALHFWYGWPAAMIPYYFLFWGLFVTWLYSNTQSLATTVLLHSVLNFIGPLLADLTILTQRDWLRLWFDFK